MNSIAVITGDIISSSRHNPEKWMDSLKKVLNNYGSEPFQWEIYRGDSFQLEIDREKALEAALIIKANMKQIKGIDVRMAIGIGSKEYESPKVTSSNGSAFVNSGTCFENLKKQKLAIKSDSIDFDTQLNIMIDLASLTMDEWAPISSSIFIAAINNKGFNQRELSKFLNTSQSSISEGLKRAGYDEIKKMLNYYNTQILNL